MIVCDGMCVLYSLRTYLLQFFIVHISWPDKLLCAVTDLFCVLKGSVCAWCVECKHEVTFFVIT
jgi:hypothetical protein